MATDALAVIAIAISVLLAIALLAFGRALARTQRALETVSESLVELRADVAAMAASDDGDGDTEPAEPLTPYLSLARPVIKARALSAGTTSAARVLRERLANGKR